MYICMSLTQMDSSAKASRLAIHFLWALLAGVLRAIKVLYIIVKIMVTVFIVLI